ncbi:MAG TPA: SpoVG family protein [Fibrobacteria bacterium]|nr:SpoVG family protein [Geothrix sp.]HLP42893.1 SpoVG family protein [Fibrobacteria bacterium]
MSDVIKLATGEGAAQAESPAFTLEITEITFRQVDGPYGPLRAYVRVVLNDALAITGIRIVEGKAGLFVAFPRVLSKKDGRGHNVCYPITHEATQYFTREILREYGTTVGAA